MVGYQKDIHATCLNETAPALPSPDSTDSEPDRATNPFGSETRTHPTPNYEPATTLINGKSAEETNIVDAFLFFSEQKLKNRKSYILDSLIAIR